MLHNGLIYTLWTHFEFFQKHQVSTQFFHHHMNVYNVLRSQSLKKLGADLMFLQIVTYIPHLHFEISPQNMRCIFAFHTFLSCWKALYPNIHAVVCKLYSVYIYNTSFLQNTITNKRTGHVTCSRLGLSWEDFNLVSHD